MLRRLAWLRTFWDVLGLAVAAFAALELAYVGRFAVRTALFGTDEERQARAPGHPYEHTTWYPAFARARDTLRQRFDPLRTWSSYPLTSEFLNVDPSGARVTVQPAAGDGLTVLMLGGSAMWGFTSRDSQTIPSLYAAVLAERGITGVRVVNLAQPGYVVDQELATVIHELKRGTRPGLVILLDGANDIVATLMYGDPGHVYLEPRFRHILEVRSRRNLFRAALGLGEQSELIQALLLRLRPPLLETLAETQTPRTCARLGNHFKAAYTSLLGLARAWDFDVLMAQQPTHATTGKRLTEFEVQLLQPQRSADRMRECARAIDSAMETYQGAGYLSLTTAFDTWSRAVFIDQYGHVTEEGNRELAGRLADATASALTRRLAARFESTRPKHGRRGIRETDNVLGDDTPN